MHGWIRAGTHLCAALTGAGLIWALSGGREVKTASATGDFGDSGSALRSRNREIREEPGDFRRMLEAMATEPMSRKDRLALRKELLDSWVAKDPEGLLIWFEGQPWLSVGERPSLTELAWRNPDFLFRHAMERGDAGLLDTLVSGNPEAAMRLMGSIGNADFLKNYISRIFERGMEVDPAFVKELDRIESPEVKAEAFVSASDTLAKSRDLSTLMDLWKTHPDLLDGKSLGDGLKAVSAGSAEPYGGFLAWVKMPSQQDSQMERPVWLASLLGKLQETLLPGRSEEEWQALVGSSGCFPGILQDQAAQLLEIARNGGGDAGGVAAIAKSWARSEMCSSSDIAAIKDPALYDTCVVEFLNRDDVVGWPGPDWSDAVAKVSDPQLRAAMEKKIAKSQEDTSSDKDPFGVSSGEAQESAR